MIKLTLIDAQLIVQSNSRSHCWNPQKPYCAQTPLSKRTNPPSFEFTTGLKGTPVPSSIRITELTKVSSLLAMHTKLCQ